VVTAVPSPSSRSGIVPMLVASAAPQTTPPMPPCVRPPSPDTQAARARAVRLVPAARELEAATAEAATAEAATAAGATAAGRAAVAVQDAAAAAERASAGRVAAAERAAAAVLAAPPTRRAHCVGGGCRRPHPSRHLPAARLVYAPPPPASLIQRHSAAKGPLELPYSSARRPRYRRCLKPQAPYG
jgi:hypothetical protein